MFMIRTISLLLICSALLMSCASNSSREQKSLDEVPNIKNEKDASRYKTFKIGYRDNGKVISFYLDENGSVKHICLSASCRQNYTKWQRSIHVDRSFKYSPSLQSFSRNHLALCGSGDGKKLVQDELRNTILPKSYQQFSQLLREIPSGHHNWNNIYKDSCYSNYLTPTSTFQIAHKIACVILAGICLFTDDDDNLHRIVEFREVRFKNDILRSGVDQITTKIIPRLTNLVKNSVEHIKVVSLNELKNYATLEKETTKLKVYHAKYDGLIVVDSSNAIIGSVYFADKTTYGETPLQSSLREFEVNIRRETTHSDPVLIERLIPNKIAKPVLPPIPYLVKDEFEKIADFERRVEIAARTREQKVRLIDREYKLAVYNRNAYIRALQSAYHDHLDKLARNRRANQQVLLESKVQLSQLLMKLLYSDIQVIGMSYDAEQEKLHAQLLSSRNQFRQTAMFEIAPAVAKKIKLEKEFTLGLDIESTSQGLVVAGANLLHAKQLYAGGFTDIKFEPVEMYVKISTVEPEFQAKQRENLAKYIQKEARLDDKLADESYDIYVRTMFNRRKPEWFEQREQQDNATYATGQSPNSRNEAILDAKATLAGFIQSDIRAITRSKQAVEDNRVTSDSVQREVNITSEVELGKLDIELINDKEIDGWYYILLKCAAPCQKEL